ncbi:MAG: hypothetical protein AAGN66_12780 [Acidobacteriota bacterium]
MTPKRLLTLLASAAMVLPLLGPTPASAEADAKARVIAERTLEAMGGAEAWESSRYFRFDFFGFRTHHWDRYTGRHRLSGKTRDGNAYVVLHDIDSREGRVWLDGEELTGDDASQWLERAYGAWINDTYWLLMPYKLLDPGVTLTHDGEATVDGVTYDKLKLTFESVGLTPGDTYWAWIDRDSGLMGRWSYVLQGWEEGREATIWEWQDWRRHGAIMLSSKRFNAKDDRTAELGGIGVFDNLPDSIFESPDPVR